MNFVVTSGVISANIQYVFEEEYKSYWGSHQSIIVTGSRLIQEEQEKSNFFEQFNQSNTHVLGPLNYRPEDSHECSQIPWKILLEVQFCKMSAGDENEWSCDMMSCPQETGISRALLMNHRNRIQCRSVIGFGWSASVIKRFRFQLFSHWRFLLRFRSAEILVFDKSFLSRTKTVIKDKNDKSFSFSSNLTPRPQWPEFEGRFFLFLVTFWIWLQFMTKTEEEGVISFFKARRYGATHVSIFGISPFLFLSQTFREKRCFHLGVHTQIKDHFSLNISFFLFFRTSSCKSLSIFLFLQLYL